MSDESTEPFGKETARAGAEVAKFGAKFLDSLEKVGSYGADVVGQLLGSVAA
jgi:hypothetical protein